MHALAASFWLHDLWHPIAIVGGAIAVFRRWNCDAPWCLRHGRHPTADGQHHLCRKHHPDLPDRRLTLAEIHHRHHTAQEKSP
jgi:hypothetical protein